MAGLTLAPNESDARRIADVVRQLVEGRNNAVGVVTLATGAVSTVVPAPTCGATSCVFMFPRTANAAAEVGNGTLYVTTANISARQFIVTHANNALADRTFSWVVLG